MTCWNQQKFIFVKIVIVYTAFNRQIKKGKEKITDLLPDEIDKRYEMDIELTQIKTYQQQII